MEDLWIMDGVFSFLERSELQVVSWRCWLMMSGTFSLVGGFQDVLVFPPDWMLQGPQ
jgi:hypothetical protein